jgi:hypothetical protein
VVTISEMLVIDEHDHVVYAAQVPEIAQEPDYDKAARRRPIAAAAPAA